MVAGQNPVVGLGHSSRPRKKTTIQHIQPAAKPSSMPHSRNPKIPKTQEEKYKDAQILRSKSMIDRFAQENRVSERLTSDKVRINDVYVSEYDIMPGDK